MSHRFPNSLIHDRDACSCVLTTIGALLSERVQNLDLPTVNVNGHRH